MNRYFVVAMCFKRQPRWRRLQTINMPHDVAMTCTQPLIENGNHHQIECICLRMLCYF